jgi:RND family efflux transporter MFP subunit
VGNDNIDGKLGDPMRPLTVPTLLAAALALSACKRQEMSSESRPVRTVVVHARPVADDRQAVGEVKPRYESELSFRVAGKVLARLVDVGASVKQGDMLARLDTQDYENRLRSSEAEVAAAEATLIEAQATESRQSKLLKDGWTPKVNYDSALRNLRSTEARLTSAKANLELARDQLRYTDLKAEFDGVITAVGAEPGQNVAAGQMIVKLARPGEKDGVFNVAETVLARHGDGKPEVIVWPLSNPDLKVEGQVREISPIADATTRTYTVKVTLNNPPAQLRLGMSLAGRVKTTASSVVQLPLSALFEKEGRPAVWLFDPSSGGVSLHPVSVARYDIDSVIVGSGLADGDVVVTAGINTLREGERVRLAMTSLSGSAVK